MPYLKRFFLSFLLCIPLIPLFSQNRISFDNAIDNFVIDFVQRFPEKKNIAVVAFETDDRTLMIHFIDMMVSKLVEKSRNFTVVELT